MSIWRRRPQDARAVPAYLAMSYLYKRSNWLWYYLIRYRCTGPIWRPLVDWTRRRHLRFRQELAARTTTNPVASPQVVSAGV